MTEKKEYSVRSLIREIPIWNWHGVDIPFYLDGYIEAGYNNRAGRKDHYMVKQVSFFAQ